MKFKYKRTEDGDVNFTLSDGRQCTLILHPSGELDYEGFEQLTEQESNALVDWAVAKFSPDENEYDGEC
jgi:hypothetical protein